MALEGRVERERRARDRDMSLAWHTAVLVRTQKFPELRELLSGDGGRRVPDEAQLAADLAEMEARFGSPSSHLHVVRADDG